MSATKSVNDEERILVIDDQREYEGAHHAKNSEDGLRLLQEQQWDEVWLDHDLSGSDTIRPVVEYLAANPTDVDTIWVITANVVGQQYIIETLRGKYRIFKSFAGKNMSRKQTVSDGVCYD